MVEIEPYISKCKPYLSEEWKARYVRLTETELWGDFIFNLSRFAENPASSRAELPAFFEETIIPYRQILPYFLKAIRCTEALELNENIVANAWAEAIEKCPFEYILSILGQRFTPASLKNEAAIPPLKSTLILSALEAHNQHISVATRAWEKHVGRPGYDSEFWGKTEGNPEFREAKVRSIVMEILDNHTWWNIFNHFQHDLVFEARIETGHGIRWNIDGTQFIGFLGPFLNEEEMEKLKMEKNEP